MEINKLFDKVKSSEGKLITFQNRKRVEFFFPDLIPLIKKATYFFNQRGYGSQTTLGIISNNDIGWVITDLACIYCGIKLLPLEVNCDFSRFQNNSFKLTGVFVGDDIFDNLRNKDNIDISLIKISELISIDCCEESDVVQPFEYNNEDIFSYKSTSGSTAIPKIIGQTVESVENSINGIQKIFNHTKQDKILVFLPLNLLQQRYWLYSAIYYEYTVIVVPKEYFFISLKDERPTVIMGVPYIYELIYKEFTSLLKRSSELTINYNKYLNTNQSILNKSFQPFLDYLGGEIKYLWTGSAPISKDLVLFYFNINIPLYQGYGMNETCIISKNYPSNNKIGSVGKVFCNIKVKFDGDGQILVKSKYPVCKHYTLATDEDHGQTFLNDGYIATGDIGYIDKEGYLFIVGRIKEMIALSSSKKIIPKAIEEKLTLHPEIKFCVLYGDNKPYLTALIIPETNHITFETIEDLIEEYNKNCGSGEHIFKFFIRYDYFTEENNLLSNQRKVKRQNIYKKYYSQFERLYN